MPLPEVKTCKSCRHGMLAWKNDNRCFRPGHPTFDLIRGASTSQQVSTCEYERWWFWRLLGFDTCGPEGRYWEAEPPLGSPPKEGTVVSKPPRPSR
jgi:hypothetical protein